MPNRFDFGGLTKAFTRILAGHSGLARIRFGTGGGAEFSANCFSGTGLQLSGTRFPIPLSQFGWLPILGTPWSQRIVDPSRKQVARLEPARSDGLNFCLVSQP
jgi:hypothetical protein